MPTDRTDRILLGACAVLWLAALGAGVAAIVALVDLGRGHPEASSSSDTPWLLYTVIGVSALVIAGAIPLLLRARSMGDQDPVTPPPRGVAAGGQPLRPAAQPRVIGNVAQPSTYRAGPQPTVIRPEVRSADDAVADQIWLRCSAAMGCAIGGGALAVGVATNFMAADSDAGAWVFYGITALIIVGMPMIPITFLRMLRQVAEPTTR